MYDEFGGRNTRKMVDSGKFRSSSGGGGNNEKEKQDCWKFLSTGERVLLFVLIFVSTSVLVLFILIINLLLKDRERCDAIQCVQTASKIVDIIDPKFSPCEDFANFVCKDSTICWTFETQKESVIKQSLEEGDDSCLVLPQEFYRSCTNSSAIEEDDGDTISYLLDLMGGWPLLLGQKWNDDGFNWLSFTVKLRNLGLKSDWLIEFHSYEDDNGEKFLKISPPSYWHPTSRLLKQTYFDTMVNIATEFDSSKIIAAKELKKVANFEDNLAIIGERARNRPIDDANVKVTVQDLNIFWPDISLVAALNNLSQGYEVFTTHTELVLEGQRYINELNGLLGKTPKRTQANYMVWKVIETLLPFASERLRAKYANYLDIGTLEEYCLKETIKRFNAAVHIEYVNRFVNDHLVRELTQMANFIREQIVEKDEDTEVDIGNHQTQDYLANSNIVFHSSNIISMLCQLQYEYDNGFFHCLNRSSSDCDSNYPHLTDYEDVMYDNISNTLHLPVEKLQSFWYNIKQPNYLNYAGLGTIIADSIQTAVQNITLVDNNLEITYLAYLNWVNHHGYERKLPGLSYTNNQLFWIQTGIFYCQYYNSTLAGDVSLSKYFVNDFSCSTT